MTVLNSNPGFTTGGSLFSRIAAQWNQYFAQKVDIDSGIANNLTVTGTLTIAGFQTAPLTGAAPPLVLVGGTMGLSYDTSLMQLTGSGALTLQNASVTNAILAQMASNTFKGNPSGVTATPSDMTVAQATALLNTFTSLLQGVVPASGGGTTNFLRADGNWTVPVSVTIPTGVGAPYFGSSVPAGWLICDGSAISRTTYADLFTAIGTAYGIGDGSTTFNLPDGRGRGIAGFDSGNATGRLTGSATGGVSAAALGNTGGEQAHALSSGENGTHTHVVTDPGHNHGHSDPGHNHGHSDPGHSHTANTPTNNSASLGAGANPPPASATGVIANEIGQVTTSSATNITNQSNTTGVANQSNTTGVTNQNSGSGTAHNNVQPTLICNWIIKT